MEVQLSSVHCVGGRRLSAAPWPLPLLYRYFLPHTNYCDVLAAGQGQLKGEGRGRKVGR